MKIKTARLESTYLGGVDELISESLRHALEVAEGGVAGALADQVDGLVHSAERRNVDGLSANGTARTDTGGVLTTAALLDGVDDDLDWVLASQEMDQFKCLLNDSDGHLLFTVLSGAADHDHVCEALDDWALDFLELALLVAASSVRNVNLLLNSLHLEVKGKTDIRGFDTLVRPLAEQLGLESEFWLSIVVIADQTGIRLACFHHFLQRM